MLLNEAHAEARLIKQQAHSRTRAPAREASRIRSMLRSALAITSEQKGDDEADETEAPRPLSAH